MCISALGTRVGIDLSAENPSKVQLFALGIALIVVAAVQAQGAVDCAITRYAPPAREDECDKIRDNAFTDEYARYNRASASIQKRRQAVLGLPAVRQNQTIRDKRD